MLVVTTTGLFGLWTPVSKSTKHTVAKVVGGVIVGVGTTFVLRVMVGRSAPQSLLGGLVLLAAHDKYNPIVSDWVYKQI